MKWTEDKAIAFLIGIHGTEQVESMELLPNGEIVKTTIKMLHVEFGNMGLKQCSAYDYLSNHSDRKRGYGAFHLSRETRPY